MTKTSMSYLDYLDNPTPANVDFVNKQCKANKLTHDKIADILGISKQTYKGWVSSAESDNYRKPHITTWNLFLYELESRRLGYENILNFFRENT